VTTPPRSSTTGALSHAVAGGLQPLTGTDKKVTGVSPNRSGSPDSPTSSDCTRASATSTCRTSLMADAADLWSGDVLGLACGQDEAATVDRCWTWTGPWRRRSGRASAPRARGTVSTRATCGRQGPASDAETCVWSHSAAGPVRLPVPESDRAVLPGQLAGGLGVLAVPRRAEALARDRLFRWRPSGLPVRSSGAARAGTAGTPRRS